MNDPATAPVPRRRGWIVWVALGIVVVLVAMGAAMAYWVWRLYGYTSAEPRPVTVYALRAGEAEAVRGRIEAFGEAATRGGGASRRLELSSDDLNALVSGGPRGERYRGRVFFRAEGDTLYADVSLPLSEVKLLGVPVFGERFLNGTIALKSAEAEGGARRILSVDSIVAGGKVLPETYLSHLRGRDILENLAESGWKPYLEGVREVRIAEGKLILER